MSNLGTGNIAGPPQPDFICVLCDEAKKYDGWEEMEVTFSNPKESVHLGCLRDYAKTLTQQSLLAYTNVKAAVELIANPDKTCSHCDGTGIEPRETSEYPPEPCSVCKKPLLMRIDTILKRALTDLKGGLHDAIE